MKHKPQKLRIPATGKVDNSPEAREHGKKLAAEWEALVLADLAIDPAMRGGLR